MRKDDDEEEGQSLHAKLLRYRYVRKIEAPLGAFWADVGGCGTLGLGGWGAGNFSHKDRTSLNPNKMLGNTYVIIYIYNIVSIVLPRLFP